MWTNSTIESSRWSPLASCIPLKLPIPKPDPPPGDRHTWVELGISKCLKKEIQRLYVHIITEEEDGEKKKTRKKNLEMSYVSEVLDFQILAHKISH